MLQPAANCRHQKDGFRTNQSTELVIAAIYDDMICIKGNNLIPCILFLDLSKVLIVSILNMLLQKLFYYGVRVSLRRLLSYFNNFL